MKINPKAFFLGLHLGQTLKGWAHAIGEIAVERYNRWIISARAPVTMSEPSEVTDPLTIETEDYGAKLIEYRAPIGGYDLTLVPFGDIELEDWPNQALLYVIGLSNPSTVTAKLKKETVTLEEHPYQWIGTITTAGTWTVTATNGTYTVSGEIDIPEMGRTYYLTLEYPFTAIVDVTSVAGSTITCQNMDTDETVTEFTSTGHDTFAVSLAGKYVIYMRQGENTAYATFTAQTDGETIYVTLVFGFQSLIDVISPEGTALTATDGITTLAATSTGYDTFTVPAPGVWTVRAEYQEFDPQEQNVAVTNSGEEWEIEFVFESDFEAYIIVISKPGVTLTFGEYDGDFTAYIIVKSPLGCELRLDMPEEDTANLTIYSVPGCALKLSLT